MGHRLPPREAELWGRCDEVLHYFWDLIGVAGALGARDEYDAYPPRVFSFVRDEVDASQIEEYLVGIETERIGLPANRDRAQAAVDVLLEWREWIWGHAP